jgi:DNA-binding transcriptional MerR regulator/methanogenic corrinoid protein MtbC1
MSRPYEIRYVARRTGLSAHRIRAWERRYGAVAPERTGSGRRLYGEEEIRRLQLLRQAVEAGHPISRVAALSTEALGRLNRRDRSLAGPLMDGGTGKMTEKEIARTAWKEVCALEPGALGRTLGQAAAVLPLQRFLEGVLQPVFRKIGEAWRRGKLTIAHEHAASAVAGAVMADLLRSRKAPEAPAIVVAAPTGQRHELGALAVALTAADEGWHPLYLGMDLPASEIATAALRCGAPCVAVSAAYGDGKTDLLQELCDLRRRLDDQATLIVGGRAVRSMGKRLRHLGIRWCPDTGTLAAVLHRLAHPPQPRRPRAPGDA